MTHIADRTNRVAKALVAAGALTARQVRRTKYIEGVGNYLFVVVADRVAAAPLDPRNAKALVFRAYDYYSEKFPDHQIVLVFSRKTVGPQSYPDGMFVMLRLPAFLKMFGALINQSPERYLRSERNDL